jgi:Spy/CpxP family protein refolding chaperone
MWHQSTVQALLKNSAPCVILFTVLAGCSSSDPSEHIRKASVHFMSEAFELKKEQKQSFEKIVSDGLTEYKKLNPVHRQIHQEIRKALLTGQLDEARILELAKEKNQLELELIRARIGVVSPWLASLDASQRARGLQYLETLSERSPMLKFHLGENQP